MIHSEKNDRHNAQTESGNNDFNRDSALEKMVTNHINSFLDNNLEALLSDYTEESILITQEATYTGVGEIRIFFSALIVHFPKQTSNMKLEKLVAKDNMVYIVWKATTPTVEVPFATDTFIVEDGKIHRQTFAGQLKFIQK